MISKNEILESGLLEQYVLGLTTEKETGLVRNYIAKFPELKEHLNIMERAMENIALKHAIVPPEELKQHTLKKIQESGSIGLKPNNNKWKWMTGIAASAFIVATFMLITMNNKINNIQREMNDNNQQYSLLNNDCNLIKDDFKKNQQLLSLFMNENVDAINLKGNDFSSGSEIIVFWGSQKDNADLYIKNIPAPPEDHIYQLWGDVDGVMMSLGIFSNDKEIVKIKYLENTESLNVTIEEMDGSDHPNVSRLIMSSKV